MARKSVTAEKSSAAEKMKRKVYEKELHKLQVELCRLQDWVKAEGVERSSSSRAAMPRARAGRLRQLRNE